jgi:hypothetical protein
MKNKKRRKPAKPNKSARKPMLKPPKAVPSPAPVPAAKPKISEDEQIRRILLPTLRSAVTGEFRSGLLRSIRSATYLLHLSCVAVNAGLTKSLKDDAIVGLPDPTTHFISAHYEGLLSSLSALVGRTDDILVEDSESIHEPRCAKFGVSSRPTAFGIANILQSCPEVFPKGDKLDQIADANHIYLGPAGHASFSPAGVNIVRARLQVYSWDLAEAKWALRDGSWVAGVSTGGVHAPDGTRVVGTALVLGVLGELIDLLFAVSTLTGVRQHLDVPTIDMQTDQFCRSMIGVEFNAHGDLYGSTMMLKLLRENSGLRSLGLFLSAECRQMAREEMAHEDEEAVLSPAAQCMCPKCSKEKRRELRDLMPDLPAMKMSYRKPSVHEGQYDDLVAFRLGMKPRK